MKRTNQQIIDEVRVWNNLYSIYHGYHNSYNQEGFFPIGIHDDIDECIIRNLDYRSLITLVEIGLSAKMRMLIYKNIEVIKNNTELYYRNDSKYITYGTKYKLALILLRKHEINLYIALKLDDEIVVDLAICDYGREGIERDIHSSYKFILLMTNRQRIRYIKSLLNDKECSILYNIENANICLKFAINNKYPEIIKVIKDWYQEEYITNLLTSIKELDNLLLLS